MHAPAQMLLRPFAGTLRRIPKERRRAFVLERLLSDSDARRCVEDFFPAAVEWPTTLELRRLHCAGDVG